MELGRLLDLARRLEERTAALYRRYAVVCRADPSLCALWTTLAREEEQHARSLATARSRLRLEDGPRTWLAGWTGALGEVEAALAAAERLGGSALPSAQLRAALEIELSELEALRRALLAASQTPDVAPQEEHAVRLANHALAVSDDSHVRLQAALLLARARLEGGGREGSGRDSVDAGS